MLFRTHLIIALFFALVLFSLNSIPFVIVFLLSSIIPDIDSRFSKIGKHFKFFNFFVRHRGAIHSFSFIFLIGIFLFFFAEGFLFPFVFGYSIHLLLDGITVQGIVPFYPLKFRIKGFIKTGKIAETIIFFFFLVGDLFFLFKLF